jgi:hypothetical protein
MCHDDDALWLDDAGGLGPDNLPLSSSAFIKIGVIHRPAVHDVTARVDIEAIVAISDHSGVAVQLHGNVTRLPSDIIQLARFQSAEVFQLGEGSACRIDQLKIVGVDATRGGEVYVTSERRR